MPEATENAIKLIQKWINNKKIPVTKVPSAISGIEHQFNGVQGDIPFLILLPAIDPTINDGFVVVMAQLDLGQAHVKALESMRPKDREKFMWDLKKDIGLVPATYSFDPSLKETGILRSIQFYREICFDGLTEDRINEVIHDVTKCIIYTIALFAREFGELKEANNWMV